MGMTITEKILARASGKRQVATGDNIWVNADILMTHDVCGPGTIGVFQREFGREAKVWDRNRVVIIPDHYIFTADEKCRRNVDVLREFVREQGLPHFYEPGTPTYSGVCHVTLPEKGHIRPGEVIFGTDSHTCTHGALCAFATGIGNTDAGFIMGTGKLLIKVPASLLFRIDGELSRGVTGKDLILRIIGDLGVDAIAIHGDLRQAAREKNLGKFRSAEVDVLCATEVAARGMDITNLSHVVNYDLPEDEKMYLHRIGRTGRVGAKGEAVAFASNLEEAKAIKGFSQRIGSQILPLEVSIEKVPFIRDAPAAPRENRGGRGGERRGGFGRDRGPRSGGRGSRGGFRSGSGPRDGARGERRGSGPGFGRSGRRPSRPAVYSERRSFG